ncbi:MAG: flagellar export chaperone FliS [Planctomycetota bacterium]
MTDFAAPVVNEYLRETVATASPAALHGMIVEGAVRFSQAAAKHLAPGPSWDEAAGYAALDRATACVAELIAGVNPQAAGAAAPETGPVGEAIAQGVAGRFAFCLSRLADAGRLNDPAPARDAARVLQAHAETWQELLRSEESGLTAALQPGSPRSVPAPKSEPIAFTPAAASTVANRAASRSWAA